MAATVACVCLIIVGGP